MDSKGPLLNFKGLEVETDGKLRILRLNTPKKKNALNQTIYKGFAHSLNEAAEDKNISMVAITGTGDFYSSGNDFMAAIADNPENLSPEELKVKGVAITQAFIDAIIDFPKPIVGVLNGPAVGVAATTLALMDAVYASEEAWLHTPFTNLGLCPEGCSSYVFPRLMGTAKATEMLLFNKKVTAKEAEALGLVTEVFPASTFHSVVWPKLKQLSELPVHSLSSGKALCRDVDRELLHQVNQREISCLLRLLGTEETMATMANWFSRRTSKL